jgi:hypothetical protein
MRSDGLGLLNLSCWYPLNESNEMVGMTSNDCFFGPQFYSRSPHLPHSYQITYIVREGLATSLRLC